MQELFMQFYVQEKQEDILHATGFEDVATVLLKRVC